MWVACRYCSNWFRVPFHRILGLFASHEWLLNASQCRMNSSKKLHPFRGNYLRLPRRQHRPAAMVTVLVAEWRVYYSAIKHPSPSGSLPRGCLSLPSTKPPAPAPATHSLGSAEDERSRSVPALGLHQLQAFRRKAANSQRGLKAERLNRRRWEN